MNNVRKNMMVSAIATSLLLAASAANANLITNGGFEDPALGEDGWAYFDASDVDGWSGSNVEIWRNHDERNAFEGEQFAELNSHPGPGEDYSNFTLYQEFGTTVGNWYDFSFAYKARNDDAESFRFEIGSDSSYLGSLINDHTTSDWSVHEGGFQANSEISTIWFRSETDGTEGNFLDNVSVTARVPEPGTLALLGLGLVGLATRRRRAN